MVGFHGGWLFVDCVLGLLSLVVWIFFLCLLCVSLLYVSMFGWVGCWVVLVVWCQFWFYKSRSSD